MKRNAEAVAALLLIEWEVAWVPLDGCNGRAEFRFESICGFLPTLGHVILKNLIEVPLDERVEAKLEAHARFWRCAMPLQNSESLRSSALPDSISDWRLDSLHLSSDAESIGRDADSTLRDAE